MIETEYFLENDTNYSRYGRLDAWMWRWTPATAPNTANAVTAREALSVIGNTGAARKIPVGVIGPRDATAKQLAGAEAIGTAPGALGLSVIYGGRTGVMEAVSRGCLSAGGLTVGLLPDHDWRFANDFVALPIATGLSEGRNMLIAASPVKNVVTLRVQLGMKYFTPSAMVVRRHGFQIPH
ncbi:hypothetical protein K1W69_23580 [Hoeflea sp. WL0058]|uniref:Uncharacterized protein n=1 Tax=Flavimaribacter sediminis TaxID=2865987 RepID=A0AAE2ZTB4_9HYPH|nr:hypothetical protein [Flavimaribacter sediminis]MBW8640195.1 hypothetical protein [Flavimaribacter sediminis]